MRIEAERTSHDPTVAALIRGLGSEFEPPPEAIIVAGLVGAILISLPLAVVFMLSWVKRRITNQPM